MDDASRPVGRVLVGVLLPRPPEDLGEWLADAAAFDAAGADALWIDTAGDAGVDPLAVTAALTTLTFRSLLVTALPDGGPAPAPTLATLRRLSRGRFALCGAGDGSGAQVFHRLDDGTVRRAGADGEPERWVRTATPEGRAAWRAALAEAAADGVAGLLVPAGPRLLDILRNPEDSGGRHDLHLAQG
jgi:hypothetical protein